MERQNFLQELQGFSPCNLRSVETIITTESGRLLREKKDSHGRFHVIEEGRCLGYIGDLKPDLQVAEVTPRLFIGSQDVAQDLDILHRIHVTHILNVATGIPNLYEQEFIYKRINIFDLPETNIRIFFDDCFYFIDSGRQEGGVLVHCNAGVSRSATIVVGYLMNREKLSLDEALSKVISVRPFIRPNDGFMQQLIEYEKELSEKANI
ncbi:dual specificity protein phosphatase 19-like isoform X2 [Limulus polyphemus]|nr:dual specificity protein phosphatase 19-like isoform X2 [Limulus polyphemus]XP_022252850.1 dual specificity protein phosphatase 19-like isoform X2 [Limulus polyphemus]XP_022252851.1 dual specificity protein phosphatase 19-like isoform X2 [Limulus polyphemus]XP_022252852.1 dual specificity protein phosphatase 19-like isoform X2 [Limulus polyphemus]